MSRAFTPPESLSQENIRTIADVRRSIWTSGFQGIVLGSAGGYFLHSLARFVHNRLPDTSKLKITAPGAIPIRFTRNTAWLSVMAGGALGSFAMATAAGKNRVHNLHDIYEIGKKEQGTDYQRSLARAVEREEEIRERLRRRVSRRATIKKRLQEGHGLGDSHGGQWLSEDEEAMVEAEGAQGLSSEEAMKRRTMRRSSVRKRLEEGHGLSDSHGGHWVDNGKGLNENKA
mmetsp:Transcript_52130/g.156475  ORF Transcript_52130/g.156475 Transcript_52130/m.156475 type:complete len:230 (-) Transcript_52130:207-896(-)